MPADGTFFNTARAIVSRDDELFAALSKVDEAAEPIFAKRKAPWVPETWEGLQDSIVEANAERLRWEDR